MSSLRNCVLNGPPDDAPYTKKVVLSVLYWRMWAWAIIWVAGVIIAEAVTPGPVGVEFLIGAVTAAVNGVFYL